ncbi:hypothetical protein [Caballeronia pedi]|uniref:hypothetical protein n=1 Tax=Caballeronia pedi TaxID=1777141 RepID=UPI0011778F91|nr:hypothetical protein [Caballeronia pedi]
MLGLTDSLAFAFPVSEPSPQIPGERVKGCGFSESDHAIDSRDYVLSCGVPVFDEGVQIEQTLLNRVFRVSPEFRFFNDIFAPTAKTERLQKRASRILFGVHLVRHEITLNPKFWESSLIGILAHEWAHAYQFRSGLQELKFIQELHADFLSGWYLGLKGQVINSEAFSETLFEKGQKNTGFFDPDAYGSPEQRVNAMLNGLENGERTARSRDFIDVDTAANKGYHFVAEIARGAR